MKTRRTIGENISLLLEIIHEQKSPFSQDVIQKEFERRSGISLNPESLYHFLKERRELGDLVYDQNYRWSVKIPQTLLGVR